MNAAYPLVEVCSRGRLTQVRLAGKRAELNHQASTALGARVPALVQLAGPGGLLFDFSNVAFICNAALRVLLDLRRELRAKGKTLALCGLAAHISDVFRVTRLDHVFEIVACHETGAAGFAAPQGELADAYVWRAPLSVQPGPASARAPMPVRSGVLRTW
jgi:anti-anti-sigma factor